MQRLLLGVISLTIGVLWQGNPVLSQTNPSINDPFPPPPESLDSTQRCTTQHILNCWREVELTHTLQGHNTAVSALTFTPESDILISGGSFNDGHLRFWDTQSGGLRGERRSQQSRVASVAISPDGQLLASGGGDAKISLWQWQDRDQERLFIDHSNNILDLTITPNSTVLISGGFDGIFVWDLRTLRPLYTLARFDPTYSLAIHPNGYILASGEQEGTIKLWNLRTGQLVAAFPGHQGKVRSLAFTPDGEYLLSGGEDRILKIWDPETQQRLTLLRGHTGRIMDISPHPSGQFFASSSRDGVRLWSLETGELLNYFEAHDDWVQTLTFSPDGNHLATGSFDTQIKLWQGLTPEDAIEETQ
ncbi:WD40 repeat domain-containing protein [Spirulina sp. CS-785/01]|uniref:WD40 repeat domain-containing protein n=1 Tax=Spirulina sp. CS-785/01 TaxID=3021716 RepID=UPI00232BBD41|nr:WD40 repeat domain-containing protein [Spirulina sp. CS-785/01]MDB9313020.1 WD40 repeat domain-containing protein [Spirulina sp. CS-785/01]